MTIAVGDVITIKESSRKSEKFKELLDKSTSVPNWVKVDADNFKGEVISEPTKEDIKLPIEEHLIVELYSK
jgi:small subunit ribosomal protein S4